MQHASDFDAVGAFAIEDHVVAHREAPDRRVEFGPLATHLGRVGQDLALLVDLVDEVVGNFDIVLRNENPDVGEIGLARSEGTTLLTAVGLYAAPRQLVPAPGV